MAHKPPPSPPKRASRASSGSLADHLPNLRQLFQRSASQPSHEVHHHDLHASASLAGHPRAGDRQAFGSCTQVLATAVTALFRAINTFGAYEEALSPPTDATTTRRAKLLYVQLLDAAQRERGEWQGFATDDASERSDIAQDDTVDGTSASKNAMAVVAANITDLAPCDTFALLNELVDVSFRSIRGPLVRTDVYAKHKKQQQVQPLNLEIPASLRALLEVRVLLNELERDEKLCLFRLLALWHAMATVSRTHDLARTIQDKHHLVFSDCSELDFLTTRRDSRQDPLAIALLHVLVLYHDVLFSDVEFLLVKQELQLSSLVLARRHEDEEPAVAGAGAEAAVLPPSDGSVTTSDSTITDNALAADTTDSGNANALQAESPVASAPPAEPKSPEADLTGSSHTGDRAAITATARSCDQDNASMRLGQTNSSLHTHGPVVSIRPHAVVVRKSRQNKRGSFEPLAVAPGRENEHQQQQQQQQHRRQRQHSKMNGARPASTPLRSSVGHRTRKIDVSGAGDLNLEHLEQQVDNELSAASTTTRTVSITIHSVSPTVQVPTPAPPESTVSRHPPPPAMREVTDLANTYFSFSFTAAIVRTMAAMAFYAFRKRQHQQR